MDSAVLVSSGWDVHGCSSQLYRILAGDFEPSVCFLIRERRIAMLYGRWCRINDERMLRGDSSFPVYKNEGKVVVLEEGGLSWNHRVLIRLCYLGNAGGGHGGCGRSHPGGLVVVIVWSAWSGVWWTANLCSSTACFTVTCTWASLHFLLLILLICWISFKIYHFQWLHKILYYIILNVGLLGYSQYFAHNAWSASEFMAQFLQEKRQFFVSTMAIDWKSVLESCVITLAGYNFPCLTVLKSAIDQFASWASETWKLTLLTLVSLPAAQSRCLLKMCGNEWRMEIFVHRERWEPLVHVLCCCTILNFFREWA